jgi:hypothetical protein
MKQKNKILLYYLAAIGGLLSAVAVCSLLKTNTFISEYIFSRGISRGIVYFMGYISNLFFFSVFELLCIFCIVYGVILIIKWIKAAKRKKYNLFLKSFLKTVTAIVSVVLIYVMAASFSYYSEPLSDYIPSSAAKPSEERLLDAVNLYIDNLNALSASMERDGTGNVKPPYSYGELTQKMRAEFERLPPGYFNPNTARPKQMYVMGKVYSYFGIVGVAFLPAGEANVNAGVPAIDLPYYMAHETSHVKGAMYESDAELLASYVTLTAEDTYIRYSGYVAALGEALDMLILNEMFNEYNEALSRVDPAVRKESHNAYLYYQENYGAFRKVGQFINDLYLKMSGAKDGTGSYRDPGTVIEILRPGGEDGDGNPLPPVIEKVVNYSKIQKTILALLWENGG